MKYRNKSVLALLVASTLSQPVLALEVDRSVMPRITLGGRVLATLDSYNWDTDPDKDGAVNVEDSMLMARFDKRLYENGVAGAVVSFMEDEEQVQFNQMNVFFWNRDINTVLGRTHLQNFLIEMPTIRDDDLISYTMVGNASSNDIFDQKYADQFAFDWYVDRAVNSLGVWAATLRNGDGFTAPDGFDAYGGGWQYEQPEELQYLKPVRHAGVLLNSQKVNVGASEEWMNAYIAGIAFNLNDNPEQNWAMAAQVIHNEGAGNITAADIAYTNPDAVSNQARAKSDSYVVSILYTGRPNLLTRWRTAVTLAYKDYSDVTDADQWSVVPTAMYRLGSGIDLVGQLAYTDYGDGLGGGSDTTIQLGMSFSLETTFNDNIGERKSIMNLEHGYIP